MQNRPSKEELLKGVSRFLREQAVEKLEGRAKFQARVAARAVEVVLCELETEREALRWERKGLQDLLGEAHDDKDETASDAERVVALNTRLVERINEGDADAGPFRKATLDHLKRATLARLEVNNPRMAETVRAEYGL